MVAVRQILVIDPDEKMSELFVQLFELEGYGVTAVESLAEAMARLSESRFDLIITEALDQQDPFNFDPAFLTRLRSTANTPIILCSTAPSCDYLRASDFGLAAVVPKPFDIDRLLGNMRQALDRH